MSYSLKGRSRVLLAGDSAARKEIVALAAVLLTAVISWQMINAVATSLYRQYEQVGYPTLVPIVAAGPELGQTESPSNPPSQLGHTGYFWSERAFHYRCALMFAVDDYQDPGLLSHDTWQQHPDGVNAWSQYALLMEPVYGFLYRLAGDQARPFAEFLLLLIPLIHVLIFFPLYAVARALGCRRILAVLGVVFYATCTLGFVRMTGSLLLKEDFALLLLAIFLAFHFHAWRRNSRLLVILAGVILVPVLASWHLSQFLVLVVILGAAIGRTAESQPESSVPGLPFFFFMPAVYTLAAMVAGLTPSLLARGFFLSLPMAVFLAWAGSAWLFWRRPVAGGAGVRRLGILAVLTAALAGLVVLNRSYTGDYGHVFGLFVQKIVHGFRLPAEPAQLPFDVRVFWAPPFNTPSWAEIWSKLGAHAVVLIPVLIWVLLAALRRATDSLTRSFLLTVPTFLGAYLMAERLGVVFLLFAAVAVALAGERLTRRLTAGLGSRAVPVVAGLLLISPVLNLEGNLGDMIRMTKSARQGREVRLEASDQNLWPSWRGLFSWVTAETPGPGSRLPGEPAAFLGEIGVSPQLLLYTGRPIVLNSQFENMEIRQRYQRFLEALYDHDPRVLWDFATEYDTDYIFINRDFATASGPGSSAWVAGIGGELDQDMNVARMHFRPTGVAGFQPVFDNAYYRVFRVLDQPQAIAAGATWPSEHNSWWRRENFRFEDGVLVDPWGDRSRLAAFDLALSRLQDRQRQILDASPHRHGTLMQLHRQYVQAMLEGLATGLNTTTEVRRLENAIRAQLSEIDPESHRPLGEALRNLAEGPDGWLAQLSTHAGEPMQYATCGQLLALAGRYAMAADQFEIAAGFYPDPRSMGPGWRAPEIVTRLWQEEVWWRLAAGQTAEAVQRARSCRPAIPPDSPVAGFFATVEAIEAGHE